MVVLDKLVIKKKSKSSKSNLPKLRIGLAVPKVSFELFDEDDNIIFRLKKANANKAKKPIAEMLRFKL